MGTRSLIGKQLNDGSILGVYCHYDGYPEFNGRVLRDNFDTADKVAALIDGGDMSCPGLMQVGITCLVNPWCLMHLNSTRI